MTKKHFIRLAEYIMMMDNNDDTRLNEKQIDSLANFCKEMNPQFMSDRWKGYIAGKNGKCGGKIK